MFEIRIGFSNSALNTRFNVLEESSFNDMTLAFTETGVINSRIENTDEFAESI